MIVRIGRTNLMKHLTCWNSFGQQQRTIHVTTCQRGLIRRYIRGMFNHSRNQVTSPPWIHCTQIGDPVLRQKAAEVPIDFIRNNPTELKSLLQKMKDVMYDYELVGISAPQIGISQRIFLMEVTEKVLKNFKPEVCKKQDIEVLPLTVVINPVIKIVNYEKRVFREGCASVCGYNADVPRYHKIILSGLDENGEAFQKHLKGWTARIAQHEMDHLEGQLFVDIMEKKSLTCIAWEAVNDNEGKLNIPFHPKEKLF